MNSEVAARLIHSAHERIPVDDLELGVHALRFAAPSAGGADVADPVGSPPSFPTRWLRRSCAAFLRAEGPLRRRDHECRRGLWDGAPNAGGAREVLVDPAEVEVAREVLASAELGDSQ